MRLATLVFHPGALGDVVLSLPVVRGLVERDGGPLAMAVRGGLAELLALGPFVDLALDEDRLGLHRLFAGGDPPPPSDRLRGLIASARHVVALYGDPRGDLSRALASWGAPGATVASHVPPPDFAGHVQDHLAGILLGGGPCAVTGWAGGPEGRQVLRVPREESRQGRRRVVIHPGSGSSAKNWPLDSFADVAGRLQAQGFEVIWLLGPAEEGWRPPGEGLASPSLVDLARILRSSRAYLGNDSGPTHLAAALGVPTVALFGPTSPAAWAPRGPRVRVLWKPHPSAPEGCHPCIRRGGRAACEERHCLLDIRPDEVVEALAASLR